MNLTATTLGVPLRLTRLCVGFVLALLAAFGNYAGAEELTGDSAVEAGREALKRSAAYPWYDAEQDGLRDLEAKEKKSAEDEGRKSDWEWKTRNYNPNPTTPRFTGFPTLATILQYTAITLLVVLIIVLVVLLIRYFLKVEDEGTAGRGSEMEFEDRSSDVDRVEQLPFNVRRPEGDFLSEARRLYEKGMFDEAIIYLFSYELVQLDQHQQIHLAKGKTNRQYLREVRQSPELRNILQQTMIAFEDVFFGHHPLDRVRFEQCWSRLDAFHHALEQQGVAA